MINVNNVKITEIILTEDSEMLESRLNKLTKDLYQKSIKECTDSELYNCVLQLTKEMMQKKPVIEGKKKVCFNAYK